MADLVVPSILAGALRLHLGYLGLSSRVVRPNLNPQPLRRQRNPVLEEGDSVAAEKDEKKATTDVLVVRP